MIRINDPADCCGCTACASVCNHKAITMSEDKEGFLYPIVNNNLCKRCGLCVSVCPIKKRSISADIRPSQIAYKAIRIKNDSLLERSSSGGAFIAIASYIIYKGGVVCGAKYTDDSVVIHSFAYTMEDIYDFMGSKYSQSDIRGIYEQIKKLLQSGRIVLFSGTPCQTHGLTLFLKKKYENLVTVDLVCHAVPSPKIFREYINFCSQILGKRIKSVDMRSKIPYGWSHNFTYCFNLESGEKITEPEGIERWGRLFFSKLIDRPSCHQCRYANLNRIGDLTIADFWDDDNKRPDIKSNKGTSLCLINSRKGLDIIENIKDSIQTWDITMDESIQPCLLYPTSAHKLRDRFWIDYEQKGFGFVYKKYFTDSLYFKLKQQIKYKIKNMIKWIQIKKY